MEFAPAEVSGVLPRSLDPEAEQERLIAAWAASLPEEDRAQVAALPKLSACSMSTGLDEDVAEWCDVSVSPDMAAAIDSLADELQEKFGLSAGQAERVAEWSEERERDAALRMRSQVLWRILGRLLSRPVNDVWVVLWALAYQTGLSKYLTKANPKQKSEEIGVTRALMSHHVRQWDRAFESLDVKVADMTFRKSAEAREKYRASRLRYVERVKNGVN